MLTVAVVQGTLYMWFGSASHVTVPELLTLMNLSWIAVPGARLTVPYHSGSLWVYYDALMATALLGLQLPSAVTLPVLFCLVSSSELFGFGAISKAGTGSLLRLLTS